MSPINRAHAFLLNLPWRMLDKVNEWKIRS